MEICGHSKEVWNSSETVWNCRKAAISADPTFVWKFRSETVWNCRKAVMSADPTFVWKFVDLPERSETGLKPSETVGKQLYPLILHCWLAPLQMWNKKLSMPVWPTHLGPWVPVKKPGSPGSHSYHPPALWLPPGVMAIIFDNSPSFHQLTSHLQRCGAQIFVWNRVKL